HRRGDVVRPAQRAASFGERAARETVPRGQHLVVEAGMDPPLARREELRPDGNDPFGVGLAGDVEDALALEVRAAVDTPVARGVLGVALAEDFAELVQGPDEELSLVPLG